MVSILTWLNNINDNGIFINPLHIKIQYLAVLSLPPALISHCDQENYTLTCYIEFYNNICMGNTMIFLGREEPRNSEIICPLYPLYYYYYWPQLSIFFGVISCGPLNHLFPGSYIYFHSVSHFWIFRKFDCRLRAVLACAESDSAQG